MQREGERNTRINPHIHLKHTEIFYLNARVIKLGTQKWNWTHEEPEIGVAGESC